MNRHIPDYEGEGNREATAVVRVTVVQKRLAAMGMEKCSDLEYVWEMCG